MVDKFLNAQVWDRLVCDKPLDGLGLGSKDGRVDLNGLTLPESRVKWTFEFDGIPVQEIESAPFVKRAKWKSFDFTASKLKHLRLTESELSDCLFDRCQFEDLRVWATTFRECSFKRANLSGAVLGGVKNGKRNVYSGVDFSGADLRSTVYEAAVFERCNFCDSKLERIDFETSSFRDCVFEGELRDVVFYRRGYKGEAFPPNEMLNVDFSRAKLHDVGFRGLTLEQVKLPDDSDHILIRNVTATLNRLVGTLNHEDNATAKKLIAFLNIDREWRPPNQVQMVINIEDLAETVGDEAVDRLRELLGQ
jgi:fluoroquinolone resistance protein